MKNISIKLKLILFLSAFLVLISFLEKDSNFFIKTIIAVLAAAAAEWLCSFIKNRSFKLTESSLITGLITGFVLSSSQEWRLFLLAGFLAVILKHLIRFGGKHIFNPAALGIFLVVAVFNKATQWHGAYWWGIIIPFGLYFAWKIRKISLVSAYFVSYVLISMIQWHWFKQPFWNQIYYANWFFIFVMLVEPRTSPSDFKQNIFFGIVVSALSFALYRVRLPFDADLPALLASNLIFRLFIHKNGVAYGK